MTKIPYRTLLVGLDQLYFNQSSLSTEELAQTVNSYLEVCGWTWDDLIEEMIHEEAEAIPTSTSN